MASPAPLRDRGRDRDDEDECHGRTGRDCDPFPGLHYTSLIHQVLFPGRGDEKHCLEAASSGHLRGRKPIGGANMDTDRIEGKSKEFEGKTQQKWADVKDEAKDKWEDVKDASEDVAD